MAGDQFGLTLHTKDDVDLFFIDVEERLDHYLDFYKIPKGSVVYSLISFRPKDKKLLSEFSLDKPYHVPTHEHTLTRHDLTIPVSVNEESLGKPLAVEISGTTISDIILVLAGKKVNFLDVIKNKAKLLRANHVNNITSFDKSFKFYLLLDKNHYVLAVK